MIKQIQRNKDRKRRHLRVRKKISGTFDQPRLCVFRSSRHIYAQIINDENGTTLVQASSLDPELRDFEADGKIDLAKEVGKLVAQRALDNDIKQVVFDRAGYQYHGRIASLADGAREAGLEF